MTTDVLRRDTAHTDLLRWLIVGFLAGAVAVLTFHQGAVALLHQVGMIPQAPYSMQPTAPWGVPQLWSITLWGGVWGVVLAACFRRWGGTRLIVASLIFGIVLPTLVAWFVVAPLKGQPIAAGGVPARMAIGLIVDGAWGLGTGVGLVLFARRRRG